MRILVCPLNSPGFSYPAMAISRAATKRGHDCVLLHFLHGADSADLPFIAPLPSPAFNVARWFKPDAVRSQFDAATAAIDRLRPDVVLTTVLALGPLLAARAAQVPLVILGLMCHLWPADADMALHPPDGYVPTRARRHQEFLRLLSQAASWVGVADPSTWSRLDPLLGDAFLLRTSALLEPFADRLPAQVHHVGAWRWEPPGDAAELLRWTDPNANLVYAQLGRAFGTHDIWQPLLTLARSSDVQVIVDVARSDSPVPDDLPANVLAVARPFQDEIVQRASVVYTTGGTSAVTAALWHARPLILVPTGSEQGVVAEACRDWGVGQEWPDDPSVTLADMLQSGSPYKAAARRASQILRSRAGTTDPVGVLEQVADACRPTGALRSPVGVSVAGEAERARDGHPQWS